MNDSLISKYIYLLVVLIALGGCGQKGDLYIPVPEVPAAAEQEKEDQ